jgi:hypothetical protein
MPFVALINAMGRVITCVPQYLTCLATFALCLLFLHDLQCLHTIQIDVTVMTHHCVVCLPCFAVSFYVVHVF